MSNYEAIAIAEGFADFEPTEEQFIEAWQHLIDTGLCWRLQAMIENGHCRPSENK